LGIFLCIGFGLNRSEGLIVPQNEEGNSKGQR